jgi:hypothetical protein
MSEAIILLSSNIKMLSLQPGDSIGVIIWLDDNVLFLLKMWLTQKEKRPLGEGVGEMEEYRGGIQLEVYYRWRYTYVRPETCLRDGRDGFN